MIHFIERIRDYFTRRIVLIWLFVIGNPPTKKLYANFCKRMDAVEKGNLSVLTDMYQMMRECTPPEALLLYNWLSELINGNGKNVQNIANQQWPASIQIL
mgnify:CR=1 FL=1